MKKKNILIMKSGALGDVLMTTPVIRQIKKLYPSSYIYLLVGKQYVSIIKTNPFIDKILCFDFVALYSYKNSVYRKLKEIFKIIYLIHKYKIGTSIILNLSKWWTFFSILGGCKDNHGLSCVHNRWLSKEVICSREIHFIREYLKVAKLKFRNIDDNDVKMDYVISDEDKGKFIDIINSSKKTVVIFPGGGTHSIKSYSKYELYKRWHKEYFAQLIEKILTHYGNDYRIVLIGGKADEDLTNFFTKIFNSKVLNLIGKISIGETAAILDAARIFITNDSMPMHLSSVLGVATIAILGPTSILKYGPLSKKTVVISKSNMACVPCSYNDKIIIPKFIKCDNNHLCMRSISPEEVFEQVCKHLNDVRVD